jgi:nitrite reductase/ring-hydroxylating ferredoxin subunit
MMLLRDGNYEFGKRLEMQPISNIKKTSNYVNTMVDGKVYAMDAICTHEGGPLDEGSLQEFSLTCPWHYAVFDVRKGKVSDATVWAADLKSYPVEVGDGMRYAKRGR